MKQILLYLPVIHRGYEEFLARHPDAASVLVLGAGFRADFPAARGAAARARARDSLRTSLS